MPFEYSLRLYFAINTVSEIEVYLMFSCGRHVESLVTVIKSANFDPVNSTSSHDSPSKDLMWVSKIGTV